MHIVHFFNVFRVFHFICISKWNVATYTLGKKAKYTTCASAIKNCNVNFILCYPYHSGMLLFSRTTHISTPTTLMVAENFIYVEKQKNFPFVVVDVIAFSHTTIKCILFLLYAHSRYICIRYVFGMHFADEM